MYARLVFLFADPTNQMSILDDVAATPFKGKVMKFGYLIAAGLMTAAMLGAARAQESGPYR